MSSAELISFNPCTNDIVWRGAKATAQDVDAAAKRARSAFADWALRSLEERVQIITRFRDLVKDGAEAFARVIAEETGKPLWEAHTEVASVAAKVDISIRAQAERSGEKRAESAGMAQALRHKPHGVLAVLGPYNFPAHLPNGHIVPALLAGNCVLFKPSELTPATALHMALLWQAAGLPDDVLQILVGCGDTGKALAAHTDIDGLLFTGSARTGFALHQQFAPSPHKILALEMGGSNPLLAWDVDNVQAAATLIVTSAFQTAGQRCTCARRLIIEQGPRGDAILDAVVALTKKLTFGGQFDQPQPFMGPVISNAIAGGLQDAWQHLGGKVLMPLNRPQPDLPYLTPAVMDMSTVESRKDEEYFGPVLQVLRVPDFETALLEANNTRFGLAAGLIGGDDTLYKKFWSAARAGIVNWNRPLTGASSAAPFGGVGASGNHRASAYYAADYAAFPVAGLEQPGLAAVDIPGLKA
jgi:succinylglutamic semialdehyde dehydrogenase